MSLDHARSPELIRPTGVVRSRWQSLARAQLLRVLQSLRGGRIWLREPDSTRVFGTPAADGLEARLTLHDSRVFSRMLTEGSLGAAEAYLRGEWDCDNLVAFFRILCRNMDRLTQLDTGLAQLGGWLARLLHWRAENTRTGSQRNIAAHYDLSNEFFQLFLDPTLMYSSAYFTGENPSLAEASLAKLELVCRKLNLKSEDHVLEIGTGWGGFALYAVKNFGCRVTTTTISRRQFEFARERFVREGVADRITLLDKDYRDLSGQYDKLVSIEMIEAVGRNFLPTYLARCESLLKPGGDMLIQSILMPDQRYARYCRSVDFIQKYIFPGGHLPSISALQQALPETTLLRLASFEEFGLSYAQTLHHWRQAFLSNSDKVRLLGFDERFIRMWDYYLCYCEGAFLEQACGVGQFVWRRNPF